MEVLWTKSEQDLQWLFLSFRGKYETAAALPVCRLWLYFLYSIRWQCPYAPCVTLGNITSDSSDGADTNEIEPHYDACVLWCVTGIHLQ